MLGFHEMSDRGQVTTYWSSQNRHDVAVVCALGSCNAKVGTDYGQQIGKCNKVESRASSSHFSFPLVTIFLLTYCFIRLISYFAIRKYLIVGYFRDVYVVTSYLCRWDVFHAVFSALRHEVILSNITLSRYAFADPRSGSSMGVPPKTQSGLFALPKVDRSEFYIVFFPRKWILAHPLM